MTHAPNGTASQDHAVPSIGTILAIAVGNSRVQIGLVDASGCERPESFATDDPSVIAQRVSAMIDASDATPGIVMSSVDESAADRIEQELERSTGHAIQRLGRDIAITIQHTLTESGESSVGQDRLVCALAAFDRAKQACVVVDLGTAVTIDFVDGTGVFHGGAILPGLRMMLRSLSEGTEALPDLEYDAYEPSDLAPGRQTDHAMMLGVASAIRGAIRTLTERYAEFFGAYPVIVATGGDLGLLDHDELVEIKVPELQLLGIYSACSKAIIEHDDTSDDD